MKKIICFSATIFVAVFIAALFIRYSNPEYETQIPYTYLVIQDPLQDSYFYEHIYEYSLQNQTVCSIAGPVLMFPSFDGKITIEVLSFENKQLQLKIRNNSEHMVHFYTADSPTGHAYHEGKNVEIDYFDGYEWRLIPHRRWGRRDYFIRLGSHSRVNISSGSSEIVTYSLAHHLFPEENYFTLHRIRLPIYINRNDLSSTELSQTVRAFQQFGVSVDWRNPYGIISAEFYWDGN